MFSEGSATWREYKMTELLRAFFGEECVGSRPGQQRLTLTRCHSRGLPQLYEAIEGWRSVCGIKDKKKIVFFLYFSVADLLLMHDDV